MTQGKMKKPVRVFLRALGCCGAFFAFVGVLLLLTWLGTLTPGSRQFARFLKYPDKESLLAAEATNVWAVIECETNGTKVTIIDAGWFGFMPSGPGMLVYDAEGKLVDRTRDLGDDPRFKEKWGCLLRAGCEAARAERARR